MKSPPDPRIAPVLRAIARERRSAAATRRAFLEARDAGVTYAELARALGVSRQAVRQLVERHKPPEPEPCKHPPARLHAWQAADGTQCVACNDCGEVLAGAI